MPLQRSTLHENGIGYIIPFLYIKCRKNRLQRKIFKNKKSLDFFRKIAYNNNRMMFVTHLGVVFRYRLTTISGECENYLSCASLPSDHSIGKMRRLFKVVLRYRLTAISGECDEKVTKNGVAAFCDHFILLLSQRQLFQSIEKCLIFSERQHIIISANEVHLSVVAQGILRTLGVEVYGLARRAYMELRMVCNIPNLPQAFSRKKIMINERLWKQGRFFI